MIRRCVPTASIPARVPEGRAESWVAIAVAFDEQWSALAGLIGADASLSFDQRRQEQPAIDAVLSEWTSIRSAAEVEETLQRAGISAHRLATTEDAANDPQLAHRNHFRRLPHSLHGETVVEGPPTSSQRLRLSRRDPRRSTANTTCRFSSRCWV